MSDSSTPVPSLTYGERPVQGGIPVAPPVAKEVEDSSDLTPVPVDWKINSKINAVNRRFKDEYLLKEELGKGGFGTVRRCINKDNKQEYAAKMNNTPDKRAEMDHERLICTTLSANNGHQNIVNLFDSITESNIVYNIYELATGGDISQDIAKREFYTDREASVAIEQIFKGVQFIHNRGYLHRDLKPQNLLLQSKKSNIIKVTDFGLSTARLPVGNFGIYNHGRAGTPMYLSPECHNSRAYDVDADIWSCGVILYQLISGYLPFWDDNNQTVAQNITAMNFTFPSPEWDGLNEAKDLIKNIFTHQNQRWTIDQCLAHPFIASRADTTSLQPKKETANAMKIFLARRQFKLSILRTHRKTNAQSQGSAAGTASASGSASGSAS